MKLNDFNYFWALLATFALSGCAGPSITFQSAPDQAEVLVHSLATGGESQPLGQTPLTVSASDISKKLGAPGPAFVEIRKNGHLTSKFLVTDLTASNMTVNTELVPSNGLEDLASLNNLMDQMFEGQRLARAGRGDDALKSLSELKKHYPQVAAIYELEGGIYYMNKKYREALDSYGKAIRYNPKNAASIRIHESLQNLLGIKKEGAKQ